MSVYRRASGRWAVIVDVDRNATGKRRRRNIGTFPTRKDVERAERDALSARDRGIDIDPEKVTVGELVQRYVQDREVLGRGAKTLQEYDAYESVTLLLTSARSVWQSSALHTSHNGSRLF